jgi:hypothetical protein
METLYRLSYWGELGTVFPFRTSRDESTQPGDRHEIGYPTHESSVSTSWSRNPLACMVRACSQASSRSSDSGREIRYP